MSQVTNVFVPNRPYPKVDFVAYRPLDDVHHLSTSYVAPPTPVTDNTFVRPDQSDKSYYSRTSFTYGGKP